MGIPFGVLFFPIVFTSILGIANHFGYRYSRNLLVVVGISRHSDGIGGTLCQVEGIRAVEELQVILTAFLHELVSEQGAVGNLDGINLDGACIDC
jgi:hypothetical protein